MSEATKSIFQTLYDADVTGKVKKKNGLSYISWAGRVGRGQEALS